MKKVFLSMLVAGVWALGGSSVASAALLYGWDFAGVSSTTATSATPAVISSTVGSALLDVSAFGLGTPQGSNPERTAFQGAILNVFPGAIDGNPGTALALANSSANGKSLVFSFSMAGYQDLVVSLDTRGTGTGFDTGSWSWSTDNISYTTLIGVNTATRSTTFATANASFISELGLNNAPTAYLKYTLSGATSAAGNNRLDNIQFNAVAVPEPSTQIFAGFSALIGFFAMRRRR